MGNSSSSNDPKSTYDIKTPSAKDEIKKDVVKLDNEEDLETLQSGYVRIHGGLKLPGDHSGHSSPLFVINLYKDGNNVKTSQEEVGKASVGGQKTSLNPKHRTNRVEQYMTCTEEVCIIPVEDIIAINYSSKFRKSIHHEVRIDSTQEVEYKGRIFKTKRVRDVEHVTNKSAQDAKRLVTIEIEYFKYVNPDSASILRGLNQVEREKLISEMAKRTILKFNLINNKVFEKDDYAEKQQQAELLCRTVVHLKTLRVYPSIQELPALFYQGSIESLGHVFVERNFNDSPSLRQQQQKPAIEMRQKQMSAITGQQQQLALPKSTTPKPTQDEDDDDDDDENAF